MWVVAYVGEAGVARRTSSCQSVFLPLYFAVLFVVSPALINGISSSTL